MHCPCALNAEGAEGGLLRPASFGKPKNNPPAPEQPADPRTCRARNVIAHLMVGMARITTPIASGLNVPDCAHSCINGLRHCENECWKSSEQRQVLRA
jgi:hypothetical protein